MASFQLSADPRSAARAKQLRNKGMIPATIYGRSLPPVSIQLDTEAFEKLFEEAGQTGLIEIALGKEKLPVLVHQYQVHPISREFLNIEFYRVMLNEKVTASVPLTLAGESPAVKLGNFLHQELTEVEIEGFPQDLINEILVDIGGLEEVNDAIHIKDLPLPSNLSAIGDPEGLVVKIQEQHVVVEDEADKEEVVVAPELVGAKGKDEVEG